VVWELDADIERALRTESTPPQCPAGHLYIPSAVRDRLIYWGHPGISQTVHCLSGKYWWSTLAKDLRVYVSSCSVCTQSKAPRQVREVTTSTRSTTAVVAPVSGLPDGSSSLPPLPSPQGNTTILVIVDRFSKSCCLLPLPSLPTALQTAEALFTHVFRHYGVPEDVVSDRGPQVTSRVWRVIMELLGVSVSLTSGFHPESKGQVERVLWTSTAERCPNKERDRLRRKSCQYPPLTHGSSSVPTPTSGTAWRSRRRAIWMETVKLTNNFARPIFQFLIC
jgi:hypothetical protein